MKNCRPREQQTFNTFIYWILRYLYIEENDPVAKVGPLMPK